MGMRVRVGVLGLGRRWQHYARALARLKDRFEIVAVCDLIPLRSATEARRVGCRAAEGPEDLVSSADVEALLMFDIPWYGLWPLGRALVWNKPVFCASSLEEDTSPLQPILALLGEKPPPIFLAWLPGAAPSVSALPYLLSDQLGPVRHLFAEWSDPGTSSPLVGTSGLLTWLLGLMGTSPKSVLSRATTDTFASLTWGFPGGRTVQLSGWSGSSRGPRLRVRVVAEHGEATLESPRMLRWYDASGRHEQCLPRGPSARLSLLGRFHEAITRGEPVRPNLREAAGALQFLQEGLAQAPEKV